MFGWLANLFRDGGPAPGVTQEQLRDIHGPPPALRDIAAHDVLNLPWKGPGELDQFAGETPEIRRAYRELFMREAVVRGAVRGKAQAVASLDVSVIPEDEADPNDKQCAAWVKHTVANAERGWKGLLYDIAIGGIIDGFSLSEITLKEPADHKRFGRKADLRHVRALDTTHLKLQLDPFRNVLGVVNLRRGLETFPPDKFILYTHSPLFHNPFGQSDLRAAYRPAGLLVDVYKLWYTALRVYGLPYLKGKTRKENKKLMEDLFRALIAGNYVVLTDEKDEIEVINTASAAATGDFNEAVKTFREDIYLAVRGAYLPFMEGRGGNDSHGDSAVQKESSDSDVNACADDLCQALNRHLIPLLVDHNYPKGSVGYPKIRLGATDWGKAKTLLEVIKAAQDANIKVSAKWAHENTAIPAPETPDDELKPAQQPGAPGGPDGGAPGAPPGPGGPGGDQPPGGAPDAGGNPLMGLIGAGGGKPGGPKGLPAGPGGPPKALPPVGGPKAVPPGAGGKPPTPAPSGSAPPHAGPAARPPTAPASADGGGDDFELSVEPDHVGDAGGDDGFELSVEPEGGEKPATFADGPAHRFGCVFVPLPPDMAGNVRALAAAVPDGALADDGREDEPHVTVRFGLHDLDPEAIARLLAGAGPVAMTFGRPAVFYGADSGKDYDVVHLPVESPALHALHARLAAVPHTDTHPDYRPHATIAYVKAGEGDRVAATLLYPRTAWRAAAARVVFSDRDRNKTTIPLTAPATFADPPPEPVVDIVAVIDAYRRDGLAAFADGWDADKHPRGNPKNKGQFAKKGGGGGTATKEKAEKSKTESPAAPEADSDPPEPPDRTINPDDVIDDDTRKEIGTWSAWDGGDETAHTVYLARGEWTDPDGDAVTVWRWESHDPDGEVTDTGDWTEDKAEARDDGQSHARYQHEDPPDPEDSDIPDDIGGVSWGNRDVIGHYTRGGEERTVRLDEAEFEFAGQTHTAYRWTTRSHEDGDWTLDKRQAVRDGKQYAEDSHEEEEEEDAADAAWNDLVGEDGPGALELAGGEAGGTAKISIDHNGDVVIKVVHPKIEACERTIHKDAATGAKYLHNDLFIVKPECQSEGLGVEWFSREVEAAAAAGMAWIECHAAGPPHNPHMNGCYTWPKFGYDQKVDEFGDPRMRAKIRARFPDAESVLDILESEGGEEWWCGTKNPDGTRTPGNGEGMTRARFDLDPGSRSMKVLGAYLRKAAARKAAKTSPLPPSSGPTSTPSGPTSGGSGAGKPSTFAARHDTSAQKRDDRGRWAKALAGVLAEHAAATGKAKDHLETALWNAGVTDPATPPKTGDTPLLARMLAGEHRHLHERGGTPADLAPLEAAIGHAGAERVHAPGEVVPFDGHDHECGDGVSTGAPCRVVRSGWRLPGQEHMSRKALVERVK